MFGRIRVQGSASLRAAVAAEPGTIRLSDPELEGKLRLLGLSEADLGTVARWRDVCQEWLPLLVDRFYERVTGNTHTRSILMEHSSVERQRPMLTRYLQTLFTGTVDDTFVEMRVHVGRAHDRIDLDSFSYLSMYEVIRETLVEAVASVTNDAGELEAFRTALARLIQLDIALTIDALASSRLARIKTIQEAQSRVLARVEEVLHAVARRDLTAGWDDEVDESYRPLQSSLNTTIETLREALFALQETSGNLAGAAGTVGAASQEVTEVARNTVGDTQSVLAAAEQARGNVEAVASAAEELSASIQEISRQLQLNLEVVARATEGADDAAVRMEALDEASRAIGSIVEVISGFAGQTNLLALNATIEAARAGAAGKGFAVVADEVKGLAGQTAAAAQQIGDQVESVQASSSSTVASIAHIKEVVDSLREVSSSIASAMEEQTASTAEISANVAQTAEGVREVTRSVERVMSSTQDTLARAEEVQRVRADLEREAEALSALVSSFRL